MATSFDEYRPFDSGAGSNVLESGWRRMGRLWLPSGVAIGRGNALAVTESSPAAMTVKVDTGEVWIEGHHGEITAAKTLAITAAHATLARKDLVVARADFADNVVELDVLTGTAAASPAEPALTQNTSVWEVPLALVDVPAADTAIQNAQITTQRPWIGSTSRQAWSPTVTQGVSVTLNAATSPAYYWFDDGWLCLLATLNPSSSGTAGSNVVIGNLPVPVMAAQPGGVGLLYDVSRSANAKNLWANVYSLTTTGIALYPQAPGSAADEPLGNSPGSALFNAALTTGDTIVFSGRFWPAP